MKQPILCLLLISLFLVACQPADVYRGMVVLDGEHDFSQGERVEGSLLLLDGEVIVAEGAAITEAVYIIGGRITIAGQVNGDVSVIGGQLHLAPGAVIGGDLNVGGGAVERAPSATVGGQVNYGSGIEIPIELERERRPPGDAILQSLVSGLILGVLAWLGARFLPRPIGRVSKTAIRYPLVSGSLGLLAMVVGLVLLVMMAFTIVLIPVVILGLLVALFIVAYAWIAYGSALGQWLARRLPLSPPQSAFIGALLFMLATGVLELVPVVGPTLSLLISVAGIGAVLLSRFGTRSFVPATVHQYD